MALFLDHRRLARAFFGLAALAMSACANDRIAPGPDHEVHFELTSGNIEVSAIDGTALHVAPGTHLSVDTAAHAGETSHVRVHQGDVKVSNIGHAHNDVMHVQAGGLTFTLHRAEAVISHGEDGPHATLISGQHVGVLGHEARADVPGHRLLPHANGVRRHVPDAAEVDALLTKVHGPAG